MSVDTQLFVVGLIVLAAAGYVARAALRTWAGPGGKGGCGSGCGKCSSAAAEPPASTGRFPLPMG